MIYPVYRLSHLIPHDGDTEWRVLFFRKNFSDIVNFLEGQIQAHLFKIEGLDEDANYHEININDNLYKKKLIVKEDGIETEEGLTFRDYARTMDAESDGVMFMKLVLHTYENDNFRKFDKSLMEKTKKFLNTNNLEEFAVNPYVTLFKV